MLELKDLKWKTDDDKEIIKGISLKIPSNRLTVVTGPNGGGKTSIAKLIAGLKKPTSGEIILNGEDIAPLSISDRANRGIAYAFQQPVRFKGLTVRDLLNLAAKDKLNDDKLCQILGQVGLCAKEYIDRSVDGSLSGGEIKRIEIATVLSRKDADVMVFDEPEAGIDLWSFTKLIEIFEELKQQRSATLLIISHQERILEIADHIVVVADGRIKDEGDGSVIFRKLMNDEKRCVCPNNCVVNGGTQYESDN